MIVIADDITGAAEIAGIAFIHGQQVRLLCGASGCDGFVSSCPTATDKTIVVATDTRSMTEAEAVAETRRVISCFSFPVPHSPFPVFKKTDSALRGHVIAELSALMEATGYRRAVYLPANPSKGRIIKRGVYYINNVPLHETDFSFDPEFPAKTSALKERFPDAESKGIMIPDATFLDDIRRVVAEYNDGKTLFAGAADLFDAIISHFGETKITRSYSVSRPTTLILCGSTQSKPLESGIPVAPMPREVYDGSADISLWNTADYVKTHNLILTMPYSHRTGKEAAVHLRTVMALKAKELIEQYCPDHLIIEGGATAWATLQTLGWQHFDIEAQIAPGVVQMSATGGTLVTLKPGSYPWGNLFSCSTNK